MSDSRTPGDPASQDAPAPPPVVASARKSGSVTNRLLLVAAFIAIGGLAFAGGRATAPVAAATGFPGGPSGRFGSFDPGAVPGGGGLGGANASVTISGTVKAIDGTKMTITTATGTDTIVDTSSSTFHAQSGAAAADVTTGSKVQVSVSGLGFPVGGPAASAAPAAGSGSLKATDVTITGAQ
jgi:hypothetical protein